MEIILLFGISILPALFLLWYYDRYDSTRPEPRHVLWKAFKWGMIATFFAGIFELNLFNFIPPLIAHPWMRAFVISFIVVALVEEGLKLFIVRKIIYKSKYFDEVMDGIIYAIVAGLGFATLENLFYVFESGKGGGIEIGVARAMLAVPAHALFSGIMGYYVGKGKFAKFPWEGRNIMLKGFFLAVLYHGLYDFFLMTGSMMAFFVVPLLILMHFQLQHKIRCAHFEDGITKQEPMPWNYRRIIRLGFGLLLIMMGIFYSLGIKMMIEIGEYKTTDLPFHIIILLMIAGGIFWALRHYALPKTRWKKELKIKKDAKKARA